MLGEDGGVRKDPMGGPGQIREHGQDLKDRAGPWVEAPGGIGSSAQRDGAHEAAAAVAPSGLSTAQSSPGQAEPSPTRTPRSKPRPPAAGGDRGWRTDGSEHPPVLRCLPRASPFSNGGFCKELRLITCCEGRGVHPGVLGEGTTVPGPISVGSHERVAGAQAGQQQHELSYPRWDIESGLKVKSLKMLIIAGILSRWILGNVRLQRPFQFPTSISRDVSAGIRGVPL